MALKYFNALVGIFTGRYSALAYSMKCMMVDHVLASHNLHRQNRHPYINEIKVIGFFL